MSGGVPNLVSLLAPGYQNLSPARLDAAVHRALGDVAPEAVESFLSDLQQLGNAILQALPTVLPVIGTAIGGPIGGVVGTAAGGVIGTATSAAGVPPGGRPTQSRRRGRRRRGPRATAVTPEPAAPPAPPTPPGSPAAAQLFSLLFRPEIWQALLAMMLGPMGQRQVPVGDMPVPVGAFANLLGVLANQAATEYGGVVTGGDPIPEYLVDGHGGFQCDVAVPEERAAVLWSLLREVVPEVEMDPEDVAAEGFDPRWDEAAVHDDLYDELDLADLAELHDGDDLEAAAVWPSP